MLPVRALLESIGYHLNWHSDTQTILISAEQLRPEEILALLPAPTPAPIPAPTPTPTPTTASESASEIPPQVRLPEYNMEIHNEQMNLYDQLWEQYNDRVDQERDRLMRANPELDWQDAHNMALNANSEELNRFLSNRIWTQVVNTVGRAVRPLTAEEITAWIENYHARGGVNEFESEIIRLTNIERVNHGLQPLITDDRLMMAARMKAQSLFQHGYEQDHDNYAYGNYYVMPREVFGFNNTTGENIAFGQESASGVVSAWMNSPPHRANILNPNHRYIGVGHYHERIDRRTPMYAQLFGN
jgi:uncharacterized protein YkwD